MPELRTDYRTKRAVELLEGLTFKIRNPLNPCDKYGNKKIYMGVKKFIS
jgi:hypothetical protein